MRIKTGARAASAPSFLGVTLALLLSVLTSGLLSFSEIPGRADAFSVRAPTTRAGHPLTVSSGPRRGAAAFASAGEAEEDRNGNDNSQSPLESDETFKKHPALSREEIEKILFDVPVFGVVSEDSGDAVLLREPGTEESIAYFFFNPEAANSAFAGLKKDKKGGDADWAITRFTLGDIWFELLEGSGADGQDSGGRFVTDGVEYRLVPDGSAQGAAMALLEQSAEAAGVEPSQAFVAPYNEVPVFLDQGLRIEIDNEERFPIYLGLQDLVNTCQMLTANDSDESSEYNAMVVVADLRDIVKQMQEESEVDFRRTVMFPPTPQQVQVSPQEEKKAIDDKKFEDVASLGTTDWSD